MKNGVFWDVTSCGLVKTDVSKELSAYIIRVTRIGGGESRRERKGHENTRRKAKNR
jgi:hypothetical protein